MMAWFSRLFLMTGLVLLLCHNVIAHHHDDDHPESVAHHHNSLEHVRIDHIFSDQTSDSELTAILPTALLKPAYNWMPFPALIISKPAILPNEPYPPGGITEQTILRGPPSNC